MSGVPFNYFVYGKYSDESRRGDVREGYTQFDQALAHARRLLTDLQCTDIAVLRLLEMERKALIAVIRGEAWPFQPELLSRGFSLDVRRIQDGNAWPFAEEASADGMKPTGADAKLGD